MTTNHPVPTPPPAEPAPSLRPVEESVFRAAIEAGAEQLRLTHWDGSGCGTNGTGGCSRCYGPSPADASEVAEDVLDAAWPIIADRLAAADRENAELRGELRASTETGIKSAQVTIDLLRERDDLRAQLAAAQAQLSDARAWVAKAEPYPDLNGHKFAGLRAALSAAPQPEPETKTAAQLLREIAQRDPEGHKAAIARGYGVVRDPAHYPDPEGVK